MKHYLGTAALLLGLGGALSPAQAVPTYTHTIDYFNFTDENDDIGDQLQTKIGLDNTDSTLVWFRFENLIGNASSITSIYFADDTAIFAADSLEVEGDSGAGVSYVADHTPGNLGGPISIVEVEAAEPTSPGGFVQNGLNEIGEWLELSMVLDGNTFAQFLLAGLAGDFQIGLHLQQIGAPAGDGGSDKYLNNIPVEINPTTVVPLPAGIWLFGTALVGLGTLKLRSRRRGGNLKLAA